MKAVTFVVDAAPPWKQVPADAAERERQRERLAALQQKARAETQERPVLSGRCAVSIRYARGQGGSDSGNIIGGILYGLQGIVFFNDRQVVEVSYLEWQGGSADQYQVTVTELAP